MIKKLVILGLVLFLTGAAVLGWVLREKRKERQEVSFYKSKYALELAEYRKQYDEWSQLAPEKRNQLPCGLTKNGKGKPEAQLREEQRERLKADLDKLAAGEKDVYPFADILYGENWQEELSKYKRRKELTELILTGSILCTFIGGGIFSLWLLLWTARSVVRCLSRLRKVLADVFRIQKGTKDTNPAKVDAKEDEENSEQRRKASAARRPQADCGEQKPQEHQSMAPTLQRKAKCGPGRAEKHSKVLINSGWQNFDENYANRCELSSSETEDSEKQATELMDGAGQMQRPVFCDTSQNMERPQNVQQSTLEHSEPLRNSLEELTQQVSAIREYASHQQDRVNKLQDGYDWNIIRTFCLRVIRCIDNLENRIERLSEQDIDTKELEEVRDELVFVLESSGIEQFEPEMNSDYRGQERCAEAVKDKECCKDVNLRGKIAKVIRQGYQYVIDEGNVKIVRTAQVRLFG